MSAAREEVLGRIRAALATPASAPPLVSPPRPQVDGGPEAARPAGALEGEGLLERFVERVGDHRATVVRCGSDEVPEAVAAICARHGVATLAVPEGVDPAWVPGGVEVLRVGRAGPAGVRALDGVDGVLTTSALGVAETGTIVLDGGPGQGPRAASLLPDLHVCVVEEGAVVAGVAEMVARLADAVRVHGRPLTMISGPSATSDIELERVEGVHGPRRLEVVLRAARSTS